MKPLRSEPPLPTPNAIRGRPVTDDLRRQVVEDIPEINDIVDADLRAKVIEAWAFSLAGSSFSSIREMPACGVPGDLEAYSGDQSDHVRGVTRLAMKMADDFTENFPAVKIDRDILIAGAICHDIGKPWEFDPVNRARWAASQHTGRPAIRHPAYGVHICLTVGLPEEVAHMAAAHSAEGDLLVRSLENTIVQHVDHAYWKVLVAADQVKPETIPSSWRR
jgi:putative nucleotidyltransferase with HDIG domain